MTFFHDKSNQNTWLLFGFDRHFLKRSRNGDFMVTRTYHACNDVLRLEIIPNTVFDRTKMLTSQNAHKSRGCCWLDFSLFWQGFYAAIPCFLAIATEHRKLENINAKNFFQRLILNFVTLQATLNIELFLNCNVILITTDFLNWS